MKLRTYLFPFLLIVTVQMPTVAWSQDQTLAKIVSNWRKRQEQTTSIHYEVEGSTTIPKGIYINLHDDPHYIGMNVPKGEIPPEDVTFPSKMVFIAQFEKNWLRRELDSFMMHPPDMKFSRNYEIALSDGIRTRFFCPREKNTSAEYTPSLAQPDVWIQRKGEAGQVFTNGDKPLLLAHGIISGKTTPSALKLRTPLSADDFLLDGRVKHQGKECYLVKTRSNTPGHYQQYWVDISDLGLIHRYEDYASGKLHCRIDIEYQQTDSGWLPASWKVTTKDYASDNVHKLEDFKVKKIEINQDLEKSLFEVVLRPGMIVEDVESNKVYYVDADGKLRDYLGVRPGPSWRVWFWVCAIGLLLAGVSFVVVRRRRLRT